MVKSEIIKAWYADIYDQEETEADDICSMLSLIGQEPQNILEVCCGSGRILVPLAEAGHMISGFDMDDYMLGRIPEKAKGLTNINFKRADAIKSDWGKNLDVVILAGNILINIVSDMNYKDAQRIFIEKAYGALKSGGHLFLEFNCFAHPEKYFIDPNERIIFEGTDSYGNYGKMILFHSDYDNQTQITTFKRKFEITTKDGDRIVSESAENKHIPTLSQVHEWLNEAGFGIINEYGDYNGSQISEITEHAIIWAEKR